jgi:hypothetical protein
MAPELVCELEKSTRLLLADAASDCAPPERGMFGEAHAGPLVLSIKRCLKTICKKYTNKARIEASIVEASIREEVSNFMTSYYKPNLPSKHNPPPRYNAGKVESTLSLFKGQLGSASGSTPKRLDPEEWHRITLYVFTNLVKVAPFIK